MSRPWRPLAARFRPLVSYRQAERVAFGLRSAGRYPPDVADASILVSGQTEARDAATSTLRADRPVFRPTGITGPPAASRAEIVQCRARRLRPVVPLFAH
jgi:hypothetical protein